MSRMGTIASYMLILRYLACVSNLFFSELDIIIITFKFDVT